MKTMVYVPTGTYTGSIFEEETYAQATAKAEFEEAGEQKLRYYVVEASSLFDLVVKVDKRIRGEGWKVQGGVCISAGKYYQAIVR